MKKKIKLFMIAFPKWGGLQGKNKEIKSEMNKFLRKLQKKKSITQILKWNFSDNIRLPVLA